MKQNEGMIDRIIRVIIAIGLFYGAMVWVTSSWLRIIMAVVGGIILVTAVTGFCGVYKIFNISTAKKKEPFVDGMPSDNPSDSQEQLFKGHK
jgi:hypothetical protein